MMTLFSITFKHIFSSILIEVILVYAIVKYNCKYNHGNAFYWLKKNYAVFIFLNYGIENLSVKCILFCRLHFRQNIIFSSFQYWV